MLSSFQGNFKFYISVAHCQSYAENTVVAGLIFWHFDGKPFSFLEGKHCSFYDIDT